MTETWYAVGDSMEAEGEKMDAVDGLILVCGIFILYQAVLMKRKHTIPEGVFLAKGMAVPSTADVEGYINSIYWKAILLGFLGVVCGSCGLMEEIYPEYRLFFTIITLGFIVWLVAFMVWIRKAQNKYLK